ncbi:2-amino-4-hydroxy-6-hydroxymethyldihydropteridine diphosphokinase [Candidatus Peribacteria bacterium]|jgi:2-amino-4-hydroxy-6-hydroxymethyldihydropteridine diphosphokinase|nr:2-amino-4-hydroxy-6-hydroxymethyldihydropteridine diphosphokinase [Candidatus Peribacteria bacterium]MBT4021621.1 2-amino-4-hydroxy-6-hydroxymethyldihydropteridine diphosphokinase [Candidatus Peribacteria bacterium]MBT4240883.1 2-amino-4-hydroxy-6-hydroxymethyldihydropteridine diphosphokinase [Candidatus Peribacteria bacterium]MBT4474106.1 2-amino-4-hydroxy-6-hydroxymethyldihydropteridine diphosphokinase [Candidatus Peribacteria bacterium]
MQTFIGIGSNINAVENIKSAMEKMKAEFPGIVFSKVYESAPMYEEDQDSFLNAVARFETEDSIKVLISKLEEIEKVLGKSKKSKYGPRTIDLDLLLYGDEVVEEGGMKVPHSKMHERRFVLKPLCELIDPEFVHPEMKISWLELLEEAENQGCKISEDFYL